MLPFFSFVVIVGCKLVPGTDEGQSRFYNSNEKENFDQIEFLNEEETLKRYPQIKLKKNLDNTNNITIKADNGTFTNFYSKDPCGNNDVFAYNVIGSISGLDIIILDRYDGCHGGVNCILVSIKDGITRELQVYGVFDIRSFSVSPDRSWIAVSASDCSMGVYSQLEILTVRGRTNSLLNTIYFNDKFSAADSPYPWTSANQLKVMSITGDETENGDCPKIEGQLIFDGNKWFIR